MIVQEIRVCCCGETLAATLHLPDGPRPPCVVVSHGLFSSKESPKMVAVGEHFSAHGVAVLRYDHRGCGQSEGDVAHTTVASRLADLRCMVDLAANHPSLGGSIGLLGSSMGGFISLLLGAREPGIRTLALWSTPLFISHPERDAPAGAAAPAASLLADVRGYDLRTEAGAVARCLVVHGEADRLVPVAHATALYALLPQPKQLRILPGGDHKLSRPEDRQRALQWSCDWFLEQLAAPAP